MSRDRIVIFLLLCSIRLAKSNKSVICIIKISLNKETIDLYWIRLTIFRPLIISKSIRIRIIREEFIKCIDRYLKIPSVSLICERDIRHLELTVIFIDSVICKFKLPAHICLAIGICTGAVCPIDHILIIFLIRFRYSSVMIVRKRCIIDSRIHGLSRSFCP